MKISQFNDKSKCKQGNWNKIKHFSVGNIQIWYHFFLVKKDQSISMVFKTCVTQFYDNKKCKQGKRTKSDNFSQDIVKTEIIFHRSQNSKVFQRLMKSKFISFITKMSTNLENQKRNQMFFLGTYSYLRLQKMNFKYDNYLGILMTFRRLYHSG